MYEKGVCKGCKQEKYIHAKGLCSNCYKRIGTPKIKCFNCGGLKPHHAKNLCASCYVKIHHLDYIRSWQKKNKSKKTIFTS